MTPRHAAQPAGLILDSSPAPAAETSRATLPAWDHARPGARTKAAIRAAAIARVQTRVATGQRLGVALRAVAAQEGVAVGTVRRWLQRAAQAVTTTAPTIVIDRPRSGRPPAIWEEVGAELAWRIWQSDYLRLEGAGAAACWRRVATLAELRGWRIPTATAFLRRLRRETAPAQIIRARVGRIAAAATFPHQTRTVADLHPLDWCSGDGYRHNLFVRFPSGTVGRPVSWYWQDVRTRRLLAYRAGETESAELVRLAFYDLVTTYGVPGGIAVDNTRAVASRWFTSRSKRGKRLSDAESIPGILDLLGIRVVHTDVDHAANGEARGRGQSKPVERAFQDLDEEIDRHPMAAGAYTGPHPLAKPENHGARILEWAEFLAIQADGIRRYNARSGRRMEAAAGRSCDEVWAAEIAATPIRRLTRAQEALLLLAVESTVVKRDGSFQLAAGKGAGLPPNRYADAALIAWAHKKVVVRFDPTALHEAVEVYDRAGRWLCTAACLLPVGFADTGTARAHARARRGYQRALDQADRARDRIEDLLEGVTLAPAPAPTTPHVVRPVADPIERPDAARRRAWRERMARGLKAMGED